MPGCGSVNKERLLSHIRGRSPRTGATNKDFKNPTSYLSIPPFPHASFLHSGDQVAGALPSIMSQSRDGKGVKRHSPAKALSFFLERRAFPSRLASHVPELDPISPTFPTPAPCPI